MTSRVKPTGTAVSHDPAISHDHGLVRDWRSPRIWRNINLVLAIAWAAMLPIAILTDWIYSVAFISTVSIYANFVSHIAGWRADEPTVKGGE